MRITKDNKIYAFSAEMPPAATVAPGEVVVFETNDCYDGQVSLEGDRLTDAHRDRSRSNPATGPVFVQGAQPGDMLIATLEKVELAARGAIFGNRRDGSVRLGRPVEIREGRAALPGGFRLPVEPVVGVIGVAPPAGSVPNSTPGDHGGNLDTRDVKVGSAVYLPVAVPGALFALGDIHGLQGDGEVCGQGIEIAGEVTVRLEVMRGRIGPWPLIKTATHWAVLASAADLDEAVEAALLRARDLVMYGAEVKDEEAIMLLSVMGDVRISQIVNPLKTVRVCIPKVLLPGLA